MGPRFAEIQDAGISDFMDTIHNVSGMAMERVDDVHPLSASLAKLACALCGCKWLFCVVRRNVLYRKCSAAALRRAYGLRNGWNKTL